MAKLKKTVEELERTAVLWWPDYLSDMESSTSVIPLLIKTQDKFISILNLSTEKPDKIFELIATSNFPANLFLKHLVVLADFGGEKIQRLNQQFHNVFPAPKSSSRRYFDFIWNETTYRYTFSSLPYKGLLNNKKLHIDGSTLSNKHDLDDLKSDMIMLLLFGANAIDPDVSNVLSKCEIGNLIGKTDELNNFIKQRYIFVSRITGGAEANTLGQIAQTYIVDYLKKNLGKGYEVTSNGHIEKITHNEFRTLTSFDIVVLKNKRAVAIEVSFQVTTNSTIERKAGQAKARHDMLRESGNYIAYVIDGAGNMQRRSAISTICENSDCTVAYSDNELNILVGFIKEKLG
ncbi:hypothetical protein [Phosphitispora fastidiosa]|uniref:hypothetical protein n=1 Tax=Phosphitispora fastidiosa TaxID=2837202 RepID=UPI001E536A77|nr:hypothetical protein [Phosphitispora fastidiosa]MBU7005309.1 hypothetical protein [Phosphitispora fastidiosa]